MALCFPGCHARGGVERVMLQCARHLSAVGHEVHVFARDIDDTTLRRGLDAAADRLVTHVVRDRGGPAFRRDPAFVDDCAAALADSGPFDLVNTHGVVCPAGHVHRVHSVHAAWLEHSRRLHGAMSLRRWKQRLNPLHPALLKLERLHFGERRYRKLIALTPEVRDDLNRIYGVPRDDVTIVPNGFDPAAFGPQKRLAARDAARRAAGYSSDQTVLLFVANELDRKGFAPLLRAVRKLGRSDVRVRAIGRYDLNAARRIAAAEGVAELVDLAGPSGDVPAAHATADLFVLPTQYEAYCLAILEALGGGLPVVTTDVPGARDPIQPRRERPDPGRPARRRRPGRSCSARCSTPTHAKAFGGGAEKIAESVSAYRWDRVLADYEAALQSERTPPLP